MNLIPAPSLASYVTLGRSCLESDSVSSSINEGYDLDEDGRLKCLQGQASIENEGCKSSVEDNL